MLLLVYRQACYGQSKPCSPFLALLVLYEASHLVGIHQLATSTLAYDAGDMVLSIAP